MVRKKTFTLEIKIKYRSSNLERGSTLTELICTLGIISIILSMSIPTFNIGNKTYMDGIGKQLCSDIRLVRERAMAGEGEVKVNLFDSYYTVANRSKVIKMVALKKSLQLKTYLNHDKKEISFGYNGSPRYAGTIHVVNSRGEYLELTLVPSTGRVLLKEELLLED